MRTLRVFEAKMVLVIAISMTLFHFYTAVFGVFPAFQQRGAHLTFALVLCFLIYTIRNRTENGIPLWDYFLAALSLIVYGYVIVSEPTLSTRMALVTPLADYQVYFGLLGMALLVEACRRTLGLSFAIVVCVFIAYAFLGQHLTGILRHRGFSTMWIVDHIFYTWEGVFGIPLAVSATYIFMFIAFAQFLKATGAGEYFINISQAGMGHYRGGPAKTAVVASAMMGSVSGSAVANVASTGAITIPLMKKTGYRSPFAGAVEAVASTGGQMVPPVMGAAVFIMAEFTGVPYFELAKIAIIPAVLFYIGVFAQVHFEAIRTDLKGIPKKDLPVFLPVFLKGFHYFIPIAVIFYLLLNGFTALYAAFWALISVIIVSSFRRISRLNWPRLREALEGSGRAAVEIAIATAAAGIVVGVVTLTGFGTRFTSIVVTLSGGSMLIALLLAMCVAIVLGMGLPPSAAYILQAALIVPGLINLGVPLLAAHLFVFYFSIISAITPPVALAAFAAASIAGARSFETAFIAMRLGIAAYIVPFMLVYGPALMLDGSPFQVLIAIVTAAIGITALAAAASGYLFGKMHILQRLAFAIGALALVHASMIGDLVGFFLLSAFGAWHIVAHKNGANATPNPTVQEPSERTKT